MRAGPDPDPKQPHSERSRKTSNRMMSGSSGWQAGSPTRQDDTPVPVLAKGRRGAQRGQALPCLQMDVVGISTIAAKATAIFAKGRSSFKLSTA
jgi:hypothetical protein